MRKRTDGRTRSKTRPTLASILAVLFAGAALVVGSILLTDRFLRAGLLEDARIIATSINPERVASLSAGDAFSGNADYVRLLEQMSALRPVQEGCTRLTLLALAKDRPVILVDATDDAMTPRAPGTLYMDADDEALRVFRTGKPLLSGPLGRPDRRFVSVLVPIRNPNNATIAGVLGIEIAAEYWMWNLVAHAALPVGLAVVLAILALVQLTALRMASSLRREQERFRSFFNASPDAYLIMENGVFTECNDAAAALLHATRDDVIGSLPADFSPPCQPDGTPSLSYGMERAREALRDGVARFEQLHRRKDGSELLTDVFLVVLSHPRENRLLAHWREIPGRTRKRPRDSVIV
jgi:PAS domain S-box-containing protein